MPEQTAPEPVLDGPIRYPDIEVELIGHDRNAFMMLTAVRKALRRVRELVGLDGS